MNNVEPYIAIFALILNAVVVFLVEWLRKEIKTVHKTVNGNFERMENNLKEAQKKVTDLEISLKKFSK